MKKAVLTLAAITALTVTSVLPIHADEVFRTLARGAQRGE